MHTRNIWLNGATPIAIATLNLTSQLTLQGLTILEGSEVPNDLKGKRLDAVMLYPGNWITVRLPNGKVKHTLAILPEDNPAGMLFLLKHQSNR